MEIIIIAIFILGFLAIILEHSIKINKASTAILTGVLCWTVYILFQKSNDGIHSIIEALSFHLGEISGILFFLIGAMTIVELIDAHDGFEIITKRIQTSNKRTLLWIIGFLAFFLSAVLDNLTTTIVMVSLLSKLLTAKNDRWTFVGIVVIAANAGGAWSPIGDVTTTMLWIGGQITPYNIIVKLIVPSLVCLLIPLILVSFRVKGRFERKENEDENKLITSTKNRSVIFWSGLGVLLFVPVFKTITHLPPYMGMLFGLGILWILSEVINKDKDEEDKNAFSVVHALRKIDVPSVLFFLGILLSIAALQSAGQLTKLAGFLETNIKDMNLIVIIIGFLSAIIDNVPLVAAVQGMYDLKVYPPDHYFWEFLAYCAGTGGSTLIIGSAAGIAAMGLEKIEFFWYFKKISLYAIIGYLAGAIVYIFLF